MPGVERCSIDLIVEAAKHATELGIPAIALFPFTDPEKRSDDAREAFNADKDGHRHVLDGAIVLYSLHSRQNW